MQLFLMVAAILMVHPRFSGIPREPIPMKLFLTDKRTALFTISTLLFFFSIYIPYVCIRIRDFLPSCAPLTGHPMKFYITAYAMQWGVSLNMAFYMSSILNTGAFFGCYALGIASDHGLGRFNALILVVFGCAVAAFGWIGARDNAGIIVWSVIYGFLSGAFQTLFSPCISHLAPEPALIGTWNGKSLTSCLQLPPHFSFQNTSEISAMS